MLVSAPFGALAYLVFGKDRHAHDFAELVGEHQESAKTADESLAARQ